jgi:hypothetical protein
MAGDGKGGVAVARRGPNTLKPVPAPISNISAILYSNSGLVLLANRKYSLRLGDGKPLEGTTDENAYLQHLNVPPGDYTLTIDSVKAIIPSVANPEERLPIRVSGYKLIEGDAGSEEEQQEQEEDEEEDLWEPLEQTEEERG